MDGLTSWVDGEVLWVVLMNRGWCGGVGGCYDNPGNPRIRSRSPIHWKSQLALPAGTIQISAMAETLKCSGFHANKTLCEIQKGTCSILCHE
jgi:hypothetical protein